MFEDVKVCVTARVDFFEKYYEIPHDIESVVSTLIAEINALGKECSNATEFEERFISTGLSDKFNSVLPKCTPKAMPVTTEQKEYSKQVHHEMWQEQKGQIAKDIVSDVAETVAMHIESDARQARIRAMSDMDVLDDYTRASNMVDNAKYAGNLFIKAIQKEKIKKQVKVMKNFLRLTAIILCFGLITSFTACKKDKYVLDGEGMINPFSWDEFTVSRTDSYAQHNFSISIKYNDSGHIVSGTLLSEEYEGIILSNKDSSKINKLHPEKLPDVKPQESLPDEELIVLDMSSVDIVVKYTDGRILEKADKDDFSLEVYNIISPYFE